MLAIRVLKRSGAIAVNGIPKLREYAVAWNESVITYDAFKNKPTKSFTLGAISVLADFKTSYIP